MLSHGWYVAASRRGSPVRGHPPGKKKTPPVLTKDFRQNGRWCYPVLKI